MNDENLESKALCKVQQFQECSFCSNRRHAAGKLLVSYKDKKNMKIGQSRMTLHAMSGTLIGARLK